MSDDLASTLAEAQRIADALQFACRLPDKTPDFTFCGGPAAEAYWNYFTPARITALLAAVEAVLEKADDLTRKSEALDAEAEYIAGEHPEAAAVAVLKRERSIAYDECARWFREAITRELSGHPAEPSRPHPMQDPAGVVRVLPPAGKRLAMAGEMRALTVRQPWATAIIWGAKDIENRPRMTRYRGRLWIHAGMHHPDWGDYLEVRALSGIKFGWLDTRRTSAAEVERAQRRKEHTGALGVILGSVDVVGCHGDETGESLESCSPWARHSQQHWMLANPQPLPDPVPCKGALGLWRLPDEVEKAVRAQLEER